MKIKKHTAAFSHTGIIKHLMAEATEAGVFNKITFPDFALKLSTRERRKLSKLIAHQRFWDFAKPALDDLMQKTYTLYIAVWHNNRRHVYSVKDGWGIQVTKCSFDPVHFVPNEYEICNIFKHVMLNYVSQSSSEREGARLIYKDWY